MKNVRKYKEFILVTIEKNRYFFVSEPKIIIEQSFPQEICGQQKFKILVHKPVYLGLK